MLGRKIFIATSLIVPLSLICALCTCAIEAAATGSLKLMIELNVSSPRSSLIIFFASFNEKGGSLSWRFSSFFDNSSPIISGLVAKIDQV